jgi:hypothetical protein
MDVALNSSAVLTEAVAEVPIMGSFHGSYSIAAAIGSLVGGVLSSNSWSASLLCVLLSASAGRLFRFFSRPRL